MTVINRTLNAEHFGGVFYSTVNGAWLVENCTQELSQVSLQKPSVKNPIKNTPKNPFRDT